VGYVEPSETGGAVTNASLSQAKAISAGKDWNGSRLITPKGAAARW